MENFLSRVSRNRDAMNDDSGAEGGDTGDTAGREIEILSAAQAIHETAGDLECRLQDSLPPMPAAEDEESEAAGAHDPPAIGKAHTQIREIREAAARIVEELSQLGQPCARCGLATPQALRGCGDALFLEEDV